jgi:hypothetical protein
MKNYGEVDVLIHVSLTSALIGSKLSTSRPDRFTPGEGALGTRWIGNWVGPLSRTGRYEEVKILDPNGIRTVTSRSSRSVVTDLEYAYPRVYAKHLASIQLKHNAEKKYR